MKKVCIAICILLIVVVLAPSVALAEELSHVAGIVSESKRYYATSIGDGSKLIGVRFVGNYFGNSDIPVTLELYSNSQWDLNFYLGDNNYSEEASAKEGVATLTEQQTATKKQLVALLDSVDKFIYDIDCHTNTQITTSDIYAYNSAAYGATVPVSLHTYNMLKIAQEMYEATDGAFNPAVYRLVDLWGFSSRIYSNGNFNKDLYPYDRPVSAQSFWRDGYPLPAAKFVEAFSAAEFTSFSAQSVVLFEEDGNYFVTKNVKPVTVDGVEYQQWLDLGGIAKGYVVDYVKHLLEENGFGRYYLDAGSSSSAYGLTPTGAKFPVGLQNPFSIYTSILAVDISNSVMSTSGQYIRKYTVDGVEYAHIIDGETGAPAQTGLKAVYMIIPSSDAMLATKGDCLTTALTVMGRENFVKFVNGYLKENNISVVAVYETFDGKKEILSNIAKDEFSFEHENLSEFAWALNEVDGQFVYDENATFNVQPNVYKITVIVLASVVAAAMVALIIYRIIRGKKPLLNVQYARKDKPFKPADVVAYLAVVLVIVVLFAAIFGGGKSTWNTVEVIDLQTGEQLFFYNAARNEWKINAENSRGWQISVEKSGAGVCVLFQKEIDGEMHFNKLEITRGNSPTVKMADSLCGFHQDCVHNFKPVDVSGGAIVCSPNRIKVITN